MLPAVETPGYHRVAVGGQENVLTAVPRQCFAIGDTGSDARP